MDADLLSLVLADPAVRPPVKLLFAQMAVRTNGAGVASMTVAEALAVCRLASEGVLRRYRQELAAAGYASSEIVGGVLHWQMRAPVRRAESPGARPTGAVAAEIAPVGRADAPGARLSGAVAVEGAPVGRADAPGARLSGAVAVESAPVGRAETPSARPTGALTPPDPQVGRKVGRKLINTTRTKESTYLPTHEPERAPQARPTWTPEQQRGIRLLKAVSVNGEIAPQLVRRYSFREIAAIVQTVLVDVQAKRCDGFGVIKYRYLGEVAAAPWLAAGQYDLRQPIISQHVTRDDIAAWRAADDAIASQARQRESDDLAARYGINQPVIEAADPPPAEAVRFPAPSLRADYAAEITAMLKLRQVVAEVEITAEAIVLRGVPRDQHRLAKNMVTNWRQSQRRNAQIEIPYRVVVEEGGIGLRAADAIAGTAPADGQRGADRGGDPPGRGG